MIAALYVQERGCYVGLDGVDPWPESRDARTYAGPYPVVAHPPCERWGRYWFGGPSVKERRVLGDDGGCFAAALASVRRWGGVLEHPEGSQAWPWHGLATPPRAGGWVPADALGGWTCCVAQGHYGHPAIKRTWLYAFGVALPELTWGDPPAPTRRPIVERERTRGVVELMSRRQRAATPIPFRDILLAIAASANPFSRTRTLARACHAPR